MEYEKQRGKHSLNEDYPHEVTINDLFYDIYHPVFKQYVNDIANGFATEIQKYPLYSDSLEYNKEKYLSRVRTLVNKERPSIKYGEKEKIYKIAEAEFNTRVELYNSQNEKQGLNTEDFLDFMLEKLKTNKGTLEVISIITSQKGLSYNINSKESDEIVEVFKSMYEDLRDIKK
ncbi:hypothetical protein NSQ89_20025 [Niallia sp. FSL R7-0648]|uniref:hypothetical protein n=1 Tax=Niallia sp. FSL R7-0648 TaxID=2954521 RepID=UPI0030F9565A